MQSKFARVALITMLGLGAQHTAQAKPHFDVPKPPTGQKPVWQKQTLHNQGGVCLTASKLYAIPSSYIKLKRGRPQTVIQAHSKLYAMFEGSCESRCARRGEASCTVSRQDREIIVTSNVSYESRSWDNGCYDPNRTCTPKICELPKLEPGEYTLRYGENHIDFKVPGELPPFKNCMHDARPSIGEPVAE